MILSPDMPPRPYLSPREATKEKVMDLIRKQDLVPKDKPASDAMDIVLPKLHQRKPPPTYHRRIIYSSAFH